MRLILSRPASRDIEEIAAYIARDSRTNARRMTFRFDAELERLARNPELGSWLRDLTDRPFRFWSVYPYLIIYRIGESSIEVARVLHGARDIGMILEKE